MAVTLRQDKGSALTYSELDANFSDYKTFRDTFDQSLWISANDGKVLYWNNANAKVELKSINSDNVCLLYTSPSPRDRG